MFRPKYVAVNQLTGIQVKTFRTRRGAKRWYMKPATLLGTKLPKASLFLVIMEIDWEANR